jgi:hypothetical protein
VNAFTLYVIADTIFSTCSTIIDTTSLVLRAIIDTIRSVLRAIIDMCSPESLPAEPKTEEIKRDFHLEPLEDVIPTGDEKKEGELPTFTSYDLLIGLTMSLVTVYILYFLSGE